MYLNHTTSVLLFNVDFKSKLVHIMFVQSICKNVKSTPKLYRSKFFSLIFIKHPAFRKNVGTCIFQKWYSHWKYAEKIFRNYQGIEDWLAFFPRKKWPEYVNDNDRFCFTSIMKFKRRKRSICVVFLICCEYFNR